MWLDISKVVKKFEKELKIYKRPDLVVYSAAKKGLLKYKIENRVMVIDAEQDKKFKDFLSLKGIKKNLEKNIKIGKEQMKVMKKAKKEVKKKGK